MHFPGDTVASWHLTDIIAPLVAQGALFKVIIKTASVEWTEVTGILPEPGASG